MTTEEAQGATTDQPGTQGDAGASTEDGAGAPSFTQADFDRLTASNAELQAKLDKVLSDNKKYRDERSQTRAAKEQAMHEQGEFKALAESRAEELAAIKAENEQLAAYEADAKAFRKLQEREAERIKESAKGLSEKQQRILAAIPDVFDRAAALDEFRGEAGKPTTTQADAPEVSTGAPSPAQGSFGDLKGQALVEAVRADPAGWKAHIEANNGARRPTLFQRMRGAR